MTATVNQAISSLAYCTRKRSNQVPERIYFLLHVLFRLSTSPCVSPSQPPVAPGEAAEGRDRRGGTFSSWPWCPHFGQGKLRVAQNKNFLLSTEEKKFPSFPAVGIYVWFRRLAIKWKRNQAERLGPSTRPPRRGAQRWEQLQHGPSSVRIWVPVSGLTPCDGKGLGAAVLPWAAARSCAGSLVGKRREKKGENPCRHLKEALGSLKQGHCSLLLITEKNIAVLGGDGNRGTHKNHNRSLKHFLLFIFFPFTLFFHFHYFFFLPCT